MIASSEETVEDERASVIATVSHILLEVSDLERSIDFYVDLLGFRIRERDELGDGRPFVATHQGLGLTIRKQPDHGAPSFDHLAFRCPQGIEPMMTLLEGAGITYEVPRRTPYGMSMYFRDPDGYRIECHDNSGFGGDQQPA